MNKQQKTNKDGFVSRGIEWTDYTWNPIGGCKHACQWQMPDGKIANCYAEDVAEGVARHAYPHGFEHHYWNPKILGQPLNVKTPSKIFVGSMADVFGHWVPEDHIVEVMGICHEADWHTFQFLTKNPKRVLELMDKIEIPNNCWIGASTPPDYMWGKPLSPAQRERMLNVTLDVLHEIRNRYHMTTWMSAEPITINVGDIMWKRNFATKPIDWMVIGAASNGRAIYAPDGYYAQHTVAVNQQMRIATFFKGNMKSSSWATKRWREEFPS